MVAWACDQPARCARGTPADEATCRLYPASGVYDGGGGVGGAAGPPGGASGSEQSELADGTRLLGWSESVVMKRTVSGE